MSTPSRCSLCDDPIPASPGRPGTVCDACREALDEPPPVPRCAVCNIEIDTNGSPGRPPKFCDYCRKTANRLYYAARQHYHRRGRRAAA